VNFKNAFCRTGLCSPSRASLLNGFIELKSDKRSPETGDLSLQVQMVAGGGFEPPTFGL
jgi:hypothetical protein